MNKAALYNHYKTHGEAEKRRAYTTNAGLNAIIDIYRVADSITNPEMSEREKVKAAHDWLCSRVAYDYSNYLAGTIPSVSYTPVGAMNGVAVCQGYAEAFQIFMEAMGIECELVPGEAVSGGGHIWNQVRVDGHWYNIDVTWDDPVPDAPGCVRSYKYFLVGNDVMNRDHRPDNPASIHDC